MKKIAMLAVPLLCLASCENDAVSITDDFSELRPTDSFSVTGCPTLMTKGWEYAVERIEALSFLSFKECEEPLVGHEKESFDSYWIIQKRTS